MTESDLKIRTKTLAVRTVKLVRALDLDWAERSMGSQLIRSATSVAANYRSACRARSDTEMIAKLGVVEEEADEAQFWTEMLKELRPTRSDDFMELHREFDEIVAIMVSSRRTIRKRVDAQGNRPR